MARTLGAVSSGLRPFLAVEYARQAALEAFAYSVSLGAWGVPRDVSKRGLRYLRAFGVLVRAGEYGYRGTAVAVGALSAFVGRVTNEAASVSTTHRAIGELVESGYLLVSHYGGGRPREYAAAGGGTYWRRDQVTVLTFTDKLVDLFRCPTRSALSLRVSKCQTDDFPKDSPIGETLSAPVVDETIAPAAAVPSPSVAALPPAVSVAPLPTSLDGDRNEGSGSKARARLRGLKPYQRAQRARLILAAIVLAVEHKGREGRAVAARAAIELADPAASESLPWDYWIARWGDLTGSERRSVVRREMLPAILARLGRTIAPPPAAPAPPPAVASNSPAAPAPPPAAPLCSVPEMREGETLRAYLQRCADSGLEFAKNYLNGG